MVLVLRTRTPHGEGLIYKMALRACINQQSRGFSDVVQNPIFWSYTRRAKTAGLGDCNMVMALPAMSVATSQATGSEDLPVTSEIMGSSRTGIIEATSATT